MYIIYIHTYNYTHIFIAGTRVYEHDCNIFIPVREKPIGLRIKLAPRTRGYKLTPKPTPYRVFTHGQASKMCLLPSLSASVASNATPPATMAAIVCSRRPMNLGASRPTSELSSATIMFGEGARVGRGNDREGEHTSEIRARGNCAHHQGFP